MSRSIESQLETLRERALFRQLREVDSPQQTQIKIDGKLLVNFSANDYLGLANEPFLREAAKAAIDEFGVGAGASRLVCGTLTPHVRLEKKLVEFKRAEAALAFSSGYATAVGTISALVKRGDVIILDKLAHASLIDGAKLSGAIIRVFPHNHMGKLESHLRWVQSEHPDARVLVVSESVFSMDGDRSPLAEIVEIKNRFGALLLLDEAHAIGVIGEHGRGLADRLGLSDQVDIQMSTLSKAVGVSGGYVCGSRAIIDLLINRARSFIYTTAPPPALAAAACAAIDFLESANGEERRKMLWKNLRFFAESAEDSLNRSAEFSFANDDLPTPARAVESAIVPIMVGDAKHALAFSKRLAEVGFFVPAIRYPTVAKGTARLRITISAAHSREQIESLAAALSET